jgi:acyl carrier protein
MNWHWRITGFCRFTALKEGMKMTYSRNEADSVVAPGRDRVLEDVKHIVAEHMGMEAAKIAESDTLGEDLGCDSLDVVEISMMLEEHFDISIPDEFGEEMRTMGDVTDGVLQLVTGSRTR